MGEIAPFLFWLALAALLAGAWALARIVGRVGNDARPGIGDLWNVEPPEVAAARESWGVSCEASGGGTHVGTGDYGHLRGRI